MEAYQIRTDLALEKREVFKRNGVEISGVRVEEKKDETYDITTTIVEIVDDHGAKKMTREKGTYITIEVGESMEEEEIKKAVAGQLTAYIEEMCGKNKCTSILAVGLGNREITPDAIGPCTIQKLRVNKHLETEKTYQLSCLCPGVMGQTGMETLEIIKGVVEQSKPDVVIAIDALAARNINRLNKTIQLTDTGIHPGAGVLNYRKGLNKDTLGIPVIGIGVPTVVDAATIVHDAVYGILSDVEECEVQDFFEEILTPAMRKMFVTPKDMDETLKVLSDILAESINQVVQA